MFIFSLADVLYMLTAYNLSLQGVQPLLDGVLDYLPCPTEVENHALDQNNSEERVWFIMCGF